MKVSRLSQVFVQLGFAVWHAVDSQQYHGISVLNTCFFLLDNPLDSPSSPIMSSSLSETLDSHAHFLDCSEMIDLIKAPVSLLGSDSISPPDCGIGLDFEDKVLSLPPSPLVMCTPC